MHLDDLPVSGLTVGICHGQASWQAPQPMHLSVSTTRMPLVVGGDGLLRAGVAAGGVLALAAGIREVDKAVVVAGQQAVAGAVQIQTALDLDAADVRGAHTIVGQRAVDLAALAAGAQVGVDHQQALRQCPGSHCAAESTCCCEQPNRDSMDAERVSPARLLPEIFMN